MRAIDQWVCDDCGGAYDGRPAQVVDVYDGIETYCGDCSEGDDETEQTPLVTDGGQAEAEIQRPNADVDTLEYDGAATHSDPIEGEITRHYYECPVCEMPLCEWTACPDCSWYDEDVWERTLEGSA